MAPGQLQLRAMVCSAIIIVTVSQSLLFLPVSCGRIILTNLQHNGRGSSSMDKNWVSLHDLMANHFERTNAVSGALGSRPPRCVNKCGACRPCEATQVPTTTGREGLQYANYEPEGWKCKCGASFFNP